MICEITSEPIDAAALVAAARTDEAGAVTVFLISTTLIFYGLVRHLARLLLHGEPQPSSKDADGRADSPAIAETKRLPETVGEVAPLVALLLLIIVMGVTIWGPLAWLIDLSVKTLLRF